MENSGNSTVTPQLFIYILIIINKNSIHLDLYLCDKNFRGTWLSVDTVLKASKLVLKPGNLILMHISVRFYY